MASRTFFSGLNNRRDFLAAAGAATGALALPSLFVPQTGCAAEEPGAKKVAFYVVGDTHYLADREATGKMSVPSAAVCGRLVDTLNQLPGMEIPALAGGGKVLQPRGVIHVGDVIDTGDKVGATHVEMQKTEWAAFGDDYGLTGAEGRLKMPVYEIAGNHDAPQGKGLSIDRITQRNQKRPGVTHLSKNGVQYSWDWEGVHFINLGLIVGGDKAVSRARKYAALDSLDFLVTDLREKVGTSGRPVVITHHVDIARYTGACLPEESVGAKEWDACDVRAYHQALAGYNIVAIFYGHTHARKIYQWDGESATAKSGRFVCNNDNSSHFNYDTQAFFYVEISDRELTVREYQTANRWETGAFTPQTWTAPVKN